MVELRRDFAGAGEAALLDQLQHASFRYFWELADPDTGLVPDTDRPGAPCSIAAVGMALTALPVGVERGFVNREEGAQRARRTLVTLRDGPGGDPGRLGRDGFFWHFLDMRTGRRWPRAELSTMDSAILLAGALCAAEYFDRDDAIEREVRAAADTLYRRADWTWALAGGRAVSHGWRPRTGFLRWRWTGYNESLILYLLGLGSPTRPLPRASYREWTGTYRWKRIYGTELLYAGPLFIHQLSHLWVDFRGIRDEPMRARGLDYFENSRRATLLQRVYATRNPRGFDDYGSHVWGLTACAGPGRAVRERGERRVRFHGYAARGAPWGPDDGTIAPWCVAASLPFAPEAVLPSIAAMSERYPLARCSRGCRRSVNPSFHGADGAWIDPACAAIEQGPVLVSLENHRSGLPWRLMTRCRYIIRGLERAGFRGGWLGRGAGGEEVGG